MTLNNYSIKAVALDIYVAGDKLQEGGMFATAWNEVCPGCGRVFALHMTVGPVQVFVGQPLEVRR